MEDYSIEDLVRIFNVHSISAEADEKRRLQQFKKDYPNEPIPELFVSEFNLPRALSVMCSEIVRLRNNANKQKEVQKKKTKKQGRSSLGRQVLLRLQG